MKNLTRISVLTGAALAAALTLSACGGSAPAADAGKSPSVSTNTSGVLNVGVDLTYPPYDMLVDGKPAGFDVEVMNAVAADLGLKAQFADTRFAQIVAGIKADRYDVIASTLYVSSARSKEVDFVPYFQTGNSIIVGKDAAPLADAQSLCGKRVSVVTATVIAKLMTTTESDKCKTNGKDAITVQEFPTDPEATQALLSNQVDAQMTDAAVATTVVEKSNGRVKISSGALIYPVAVGLAVQKGNAELQEALTKSLANLTSAGTYGTILKKYNLEPVDSAVLAESLKQG
ncbi:ABC transporter substrate-binding protein [Arthrobacter sp. 35W]|uniref:ABC transporter substrate-binding protein n=1 Tax=Arthrobacter sp. 35W TaxID=1132441 RepID=UPI000422A14B|nr:ABC transporter substrate-binding protein [Arthrobacter sp. 35W]